MLKAVSMLLSETVCSRDAALEPPGRVYGVSQRTTSARLAAKFVMQQCQRIFAYWASSKLETRDRLSYWLYYKGCIFTIEKECCHETARSSVYFYQPRYALVVVFLAAFFLSKSLMLIRFTGRNSGRSFTTPVRYVMHENNIRCFTSRQNQWWRNLSSSAEVELLIAGKWGKYYGTASEGDALKVRPALEHYLGLFPADAVYHDIRVNKDRTLNEDDLSRACGDAVVVEARPV